MLSRRKSREQGKRMCLPFRGSSRKGKERKWNKKGREEKERKENGRKGNRKGREGEKRKRKNRREMKGITMEHHQQT